MTTSKPTGRIALVLGATGGVGGETAAALARHGWTVRALARDPTKGGQLASGLELDRRRRHGPRGGGRGGAGRVDHRPRGEPARLSRLEQLVLPMIDNTIAAAQGQRRADPAAGHDLQLRPRLPAARRDLAAAPDPQGRDPHRHGGAPGSRRGAKACAR
jgi:NAD(P)-dependent dehydrogenase (short-subunit alcohol dehydrogenase family)